MGGVQVECEEECGRRDAFKMSSLTREGRGAKVAIGSQTLRSEALATRSRRGNSALAGCNLGTRHFSDGRRVVMLNEVGEDARRRQERMRAWSPWWLVAVGTASRIVC
jgi:hypothetical protein